MQLWIQEVEQEDKEAKPLFCVSVKSTTPTELPNPGQIPVIGYDKKRLLPELAWYLEQYLAMPVGADAQRADAIVATLQAWGKAVFDALFVRDASAWYRTARENLSDLEIKIVSASPAVLSWPWEAIYSGDDGYLAQRCCIERQPPNLNLPYKMPKKTDALHILFIVSRPDTESKVGYHGLEREIIRYVHDKNFAVTVDVLRPPTFDNLRTVLEARRGYYHIIHFDGHGHYAHAGKRSKGQLAFETDAPEEKVGADLVSAEKLGELLKNCGVSMAVLNACQSAMIDGQTNDPFASVAARLLQAGIPSVVAMGYSLSLSAAKQFVPAFYAALFRNGDPAGAIRAGRRAMYAHPERPCFYGECPLQDWIIPQLHQQVSAEERILPAVGKASRTREDAFPDELRKIGDYGLIGRGREIHDLERILQRRTQAGILIHGMAGAGKTTLAKGFLQWLRDTSGLREADGADCPVFWFNFQEIHSAEAILNPLADAFLGETARTMEPEQILDALTDILKTRRAYLVWDNFESASGIPGTEVVAFMSKKERGTLKTLLRNLRDGKTRVFITSRTNEDWLGEECARLETLGGLEGDELWDYCREVVRDLGLTIDRHDKDLKALLEKLDGNPLALRVILLRLGEGKKAKDLLEELDRQFTGAVGDDGTEQIQKAFGVLKAGIDPALSPVLQVIGLHERFADADYVTNILGLIEQAKPDSPEARNIIDRVTRCFNILENVGLCIHERGALYRLHPALRGCLAVMYLPPEDVKRWFVRFMAYVEYEVHNDDAQLVGLFSYYEANFFHAKRLAEALDMREEDLSLTFGLADYAADRSRTALEEERYREMAEKAHRYGDFDKENQAYRQLAICATDPERQRFWTQKAVDMWNGAEALSADAYFTLGHNAMAQGDLSAAIEHFKRVLAIWEREEDTRAVDLYGFLGECTRQQVDMDSAKEWFQKYWQKAKEVGNLKSQAIANNALGNIAAERGNAPEAWERYQEALEIYQALQDPRNIAGVLNNMGILLRQLGAYDAAKDALIQSVQIAEHIGDVQLTAANYNALGALSVKQGDFVSARDWFAKALSMLEAMGDTENAAIARRNLERVTVDEAAQHKKEEST